MAPSRSSPNRRSSTHGLSLVLAALAAALFACSLPNVGGRLDPVIQGPWTDEIGAQGGSLTAPGLQLEVPADALDEPTLLHVDLAESNNPADLSAFELGPDGLTFSKPVTVTVSYAGILPDDAQATSLSLIHASEQGEEPVADQALDRKAEQISGTIEHFSWIFLRLFDDEEDRIQLSGVDTVELQEADSSSRYEVFLAYSPGQDSWELLVTVGHEAGDGVYQFSAEGNITIDNQAGLTEGSLPLHGECLFATGDSPSITGFDNVGVPFEILSGETPQAGDTATVVMNRHSLPLYAVDTEDEQSCPVFGPRQNFEILLEERIAPVPLGDD
ncbi:MAG: hypothetical protein R3191_01170 [Anaerolineales bacterium]|nr:hypothetical protein [Anaerolineales bacterium]